MATADKTIRFSVAAAPSMPSWYPASAGAIINLSQTLSDTSTQRSVALAVGAGSYPGTESARLDPYSGGALVYEAGRPFLHCYGGGHSDGSWNGTIKYGPVFGAGSNAPTWSLGAAPSALGAVRQCTSGNGNTTYTDGRVPANHTYNWLVGIGARLYAIGASAYYGDGNVGMFRPHWYDTDTSTWGLAANAAPNTGSTGTGGGGAAWNGRLYIYHGADFLHPLKIMDLGTDVWSVEPNADTYVSGDSAMLAVDTRRGALLVMGSSSGPVGIYWPTLTPPYAGRRQTIPRPPSTATHSMVYDYDRDVFVIPAAGSRDVYECSASGLAAGSNPAWTTRSFTGATPAAQAGTGTKGRFQWVSELKGYLCVPSALSDVYFYRAV